ncbi:MAG: YihY/virulence factor BrkB family protein [Bryobacteraceae bacterium]
MVAWKRCLLLLRRTFLAAFGHRCFGIAKAAAYSALLSFFPVLASAAAILVEVKADFVARYVARFLFDVVPPGTEELVRIQFTAKGERPAGLLIAAVLLSIWAASGVIGSLIDGFEAAYGITQRRRFPRNMMVSMTLVLLSAVPLLAASLLIVFGGFIDRFIMRWLAGDSILTPLAGWWQTASSIARFLTAFCTLAWVNATIYYYGPNRRQQWGLVWPGAVVATAAGLLATVAFGWYVRNIADYNVAYGSMGAGIALLVWMYLLALITLLGCEFNAQYERPRE